MAAGTAVVKVCRDVAGEEGHVVQVVRPTAVGEEDTGLEEVEEHPTVAGGDTGPLIGTDQAEGADQGQGHHMVADGGIGSLREGRPYGC